jgi:hypothetical protein
MNESSDGLSKLFQEYRAACPDPDASPAFTPGLWQKIEARQSFVWKLRYYARGLVTITAAACLVVAIFGAAFPGHTANPVYSYTYVETLDAASSPEVLAYADIIRTDYGSFDNQ